VQGDIRTERGGIRADAAEEETVKTEESIIARSKTGSHSITEPFFLHRQHVPDDRERKEEEENRPWRGDMNKGRK